MTEFNPKQGEVIHVRNDEDSAWLERTFVTKYRGLYHCELFGDDRLYPWEDVKPLPAEPEPTEYTRQTWPKQQVMLRHRKWAEDCMTVMAGFNVGGVELSGNTVPYGKLKRDYLMSFDWGGTWQPCHYVPEQP